MVARVFKAGGLGGLLRRFAHSTQGGIAVFAAGVIPVLALLAIGATELQGVEHDRSVMQDIADAVVLKSAHELSLANTDGVTERAEGDALNKLASLAARATVQADAVIEDEGRSIRLVLRSNRTSFFGNLLPPGGFNSVVHAKAVIAHDRPICVLALEERSGVSLSVEGSSELAAENCLVHSNRDLSAKDVSKIAAGQVGAVGAATGAITPDPRTGESPIEDPFAERDLPVLNCGSPVTQRITTSRTLAQGMHCGPVIVDGDAQLTLAPGIHYFQRGGLIAQGASRVVGDNVVLVFGTTSQFNFADSATVELTGARSGIGAGIVIATTRDNTRPFMISSSNVRRMEGVVYMPSAQLVVTGGRETLAESDWTVSITRELVVRNGAKLVINSNYNASTVPVPDDVKAPPGSVRLVD